MERVTIIGGTGFVGDYLVKRIIQNRRIQLKVIFRNTPPLEILKNVEYLQINKSSEISKLKDVLEETDYLIILARPDRNLIKNIISFNLKFKKILYTSSILIYPSSDKKQKEDSDFVPTSGYEKQKIEEENMLCEFAKRLGNKLVIARLANVYGDVKNRALIHWILEAAVKNSTFKLNNRGEPIRDFMFIEDVARYLDTLLFLNQESEIEMFNVCTGKGFSINQVLKMVEKITGRKLMIEQGEETREKLSIIGDNSKIVLATGIRPEYNFKSGLEKAYANYLRN